MSDINFDKYGNEEFFKLFLEATKETYGDYCTFKAREENLTKYSEPVFEKAIEEAALRISSIEQQLAKANEIISECWRLVGNDVDSKSTLPEHVNALNERVKELEKAVEDGFFEASCYDVDVIQCLNKMAYVHNEKDIPRFRDKAKRCAERISNRTSDLNKFAIEKKIEGAFSFANYLDKSNFSAAIAAKESGFFQLVESFSQQLRKEQG